MTLIFHTPHLEEASTVTMSMYQPDNKFCGDDSTNPANHFSTLYYPHQDHVYDTCQEFIQRWRPVIPNPLFFKNYVHETKV